MAVCPSRYRWSGPDTTTAAPAPEAVRTTSSPVTATARSADLTPVIERSVTGGPGEPGGSAEDAAGGPPGMGDPVDRRRVRPEGDEPDRGDQHVQERPGDEDEHPLAPLHQPHA